jgi:hypothetical protein
MEKNFSIRLPRAMRVLPFAPAIFPISKKGDPKTALSQLNRMARM